MKKTPGEPGTALPDAQSPLEPRLDVLRHLFPEAFSEGQLDFDKLRLALGDAANDEIYDEPGDAAGDAAPPPERYGLTWAGKRDALRAVQEPSRGTLEPLRGESVDFDASRNAIIEGDNLEVLKLLQRSYYGKIKMIYIDPPYNTGNEFIYTDNFREGLGAYLRYSGQRKADGTRQTSREEHAGRKHSSWLTMMYPRLALARDLLTDDGVIFVSIDDHEAKNLHFVLAELFGEENYVATFPWRKRTAKSDVPFGVSQDYEWIVAFTKGAFRAGAFVARRYHYTSDFGSGWRLADLTKQTSANERPNSNFTMVNPKTLEAYPANPHRVWSITRETFRDYYDRGKIVFPGDYDFLNLSRPAYRVFETEDREKNLKKFGVEEARKSLSTVLPSSVGRTEDGTKEVTELFGEKLFAFPKPVSLLKFLINTTPERDFIVLDFFAGSGTLAQAVLELNEADGGDRTFLLVQLPEPTGRTDFPTVAAITRERVRRVIRKLGRADEERASAADRGFRAFRLSASNFKTWDFRRWDGAVRGAAALGAQLSAFADNLAGEDEQSILYELLLKAGLPLSASVETLGASQEVYAAEGKALYVCLARPLAAETVEAVLSARPARFICLDAAFAGNDAFKTNTVLAMRRAGIAFHTV